MTVYTGDGNDKSVQIKSIRKEAPTRVYLGEGDDIASVLPSLNGDNYGLQFLTDTSLNPHDKLKSLVTTAMTGSTFRSSG